MKSKKIMGTALFGFILISAMATWVCASAATNTLGGATTPPAVTGSAMTSSVISSLVAPKILEKTPKSLFLVKKIKISPDVGEPQFNPQEAQLRTVINDPVLHNTKKFE